MWNILEALEGLTQDTADYILLHASWPAIAHDVSGASFVHEAQGDVEFVAIHPRTTDTQDVGVFGKGHEGCFALEEGEGVRG
jgi:hypothetical protein